MPKSTGLRCSGLSRAKAVLVASPSEIFESDSWLFALQSILTRSLPNVFSYASFFSNLPISLCKISDILSYKMQTCGQLFWKNGEEIFKHRWNVTDKFQLCLCFLPFFVSQHCYNSLVRSILQGCFWIFSQVLHKVADAIPLLQNSHHRATHKKPSLYALRCYASPSLWQLVKCDSLLVLLCYTWKGSGYPSIQCPFCIPLRPCRKHYGHNLSSQYLAVEMWVVFFDCSFYFSKKIFYWHWGHLLPKYRTLLWGAHLSPLFGTCSKLPSYPLHEQKITRCRSLPTLCYMGWDQ